MLECPFTEKVCYNGLPGNCCSVDYGFVFIFYDHPLDGAGILSTFILPPAGILFGLSAYKKTRSRKDIILILLNAAAFVSYFAYMFFGTLILGP